MFFKSLIGLLILSLISVAPAAAHEISPPFVQVNNSYVIHNPIPVSGSEPLEITHEVSPQNFSVLKEIGFKVDTLELHKPVDWRKSASFSWDFGDGTKTAGPQAKHTYKKSGSFFVTLFAKIDDNDPQVITKFTLNILPMPNYQLPVAQIQLNEASPSSSQVFAPFSNEFSFDASKSKTGSAAIAEYFWDFGDGETAYMPQVKHKFDARHYNSFVVLRVKDANGFISDSYIEIVNQQNTRKIDEVLTNLTDPSSKSFYGFTVLGVGVLLLAGFFLFRKYSFKRKR